MAAIARSQYVAKDAGSEQRTPHRNLPNKFETRVHVSGSDRSWPTGADETGQKIQQEGCMAEKEKHVGGIRKKGKEEPDRIVVKGADYKGKPYADIRTYYVDESGDWRPTKKGVAFHSVDQL